MAHDARLSEAELLAEILSIVHAECFADPSSLLWDAEGVAAPHGSEPADLDSIAIVVATIVIQGLSGLDVPPDDEPGPTGVDELYGYYRRCVALAEQRASE